MKLFLKLFVVSFLLISCGGQKVDKLYVNAKIWTGDTSNPSASVMAIKGEKIVYVGNDASKYTADETIDIGGKLLLP